MNDCKDCTCEMKSVSNNLFCKNKNIFCKNKNIFCKKNGNNSKFLLPLEFAFYLGSISIFTYYNYNKLTIHNILNKANKN